MLGQLVVLQEEPQLDQRERQLQHPVLAAMAAPPNFVHNVLTSLLNGADVNSMGEQNKRALLEAVACIRKASAWTGER